MPEFSLSWTAYQNFLYGWIILAILIFFLLLKVTAPYGRHANKNWGPMITNKWAWMIMELPVLIVLGIFIIPVVDSLAAVSLLMIGLFSFHYLNRIFIFPFRIRTKGKKMPLIIMLSAIFFNIVNGFSFGFFFLKFADYSNAWFTDTRFIAGSVLFIAGLYINWRADTILIHLRKPGEADYKIPTGWLFENISCPNLFGELLEWLGFAILCWNLPALTFFIWTAANLIPRGMAHHKWYKERFKEYPDERKAVIPFVL